MEPTDKTDEDPDDRTVLARFMGVPDRYDWTPNMREVERKLADQAFVMEYARQLSAVRADEPIGYRELSEITLIYNLMFATDAHRIEAAARVLRERGR